MIGKEGWRVVYSLSDGLVLKLAAVGAEHGEEAIMASRFPKFLSPLCCLPGSL